MFDFIFDVMFAWQQVGLMFMGIVFMSVGGGIVFYEIYSRVNSTKVEGRISAVRVTGGREGSKKKSFSGEMYRAVFEYKAANGERLETVSSMASNGLIGKLPGKRVTLLVSPHDYKNARRPSIILPVFGLIFFLPGVFIMNIALTSFDINYASIFLFLSLLVLIAYKTRKGILKIQPEMRKEFWSKINKDGFSGVKATSSKKKDKGRVLDQSEIMERVNVYMKHARIAAYIMLLIAPVFAGGAYYTGTDMMDRMNNDAQVVGEVVGIESQYSSNSDGGSSYTYYSIVKFEDINGRTVRFQDGVGASSPMHKRGDEVDVLYSPEDPKDAIINRGVFNWVLSAALGLGALLMLWGAMHNLKTSQRRI